MTTPMDDDATEDAAETTCPNCGKPVTPGMETCPNCGAHL